MVETNSILEKKLKKLAVQLHLEYFGKGPEDVWVKIYRNVVSFYCSKTVTPLEETILKITNGKEEVLRIREKILEHIKPNLFSEIGKVSNNMVLSFTADLCIETKALHGSILFLHELEKDNS
ncbi:MAG: DUF2294 family protein [Clostridia bacterium]|nr:DUF2294 family protein [Clostridia bacterium]